MMIRIKAISFTYGYAGITPRLTSISYPNGQNTTYSYQTGSTQDYRLTEIDNFNASSAVISKFDYTYTTLGNIATWQQQVDSSTPTVWSYGYDQADQLTSATRTNTSTSAVISRYVYGYDLAGNRKSEQIGLSATQASFNNVNQTTSASAGGPLQFTGTLSKPAQVSVAGNAATTSYSTNFTGTANVSTGTNTVAVVAQDVDGNAATNNYQVVVPTGTSVSPTYDVNGNLTDNGNGQTYTWDALNELVKITYTGGATSNFTYDGRSRRTKIVEKNNSGTITSTKQLVWLGNNIAEERDASDTVIKRYYAQGMQAPIANSPLDKLYYTRDHLGSVREMTNSSGTIVAGYDYDPYGRTTLVSGTNLSDFQYAGMYLHVPSGLNLTLYRAYDSNTAKWLSRDPLEEEGGVNLYGYVENNPIDLVDTYGLSPFNSKRAPKATPAEKYESILHAQKVKGRNHINSTGKSECNDKNGLKPHNLPGDDDDNDLNPPEQPGPPAPPTPPAPPAPDPEADAKAKAEQAQKPKLTPDEEKAIIMEEVD